MNNETVNNFANFNYKNFGDLLLSLSPLELSSLGCILGIYIAIPLDKKASASLGNFFNLIGQVLLVYSSQEMYLAPNNATVNDINNLREEFFTYINNFCTKK